MGADTLIGLDIGSTSVRAVQTRRGKAGPVIVQFGHAPLPRGAVQGGVIHDEKAVTATLKQLWSGTRFRGRKVILGVTNRQVVVREMSLSNLPDRELRESLPLQVRQVLPLPVERSLLDFCRLEDPGSNKTVRGLVIAAPKDAVLTAVRATEHAGLHVRRVDLASFALLRAASRLDANVEAIVDIGAAATTVVVHKDGEPLIVRTIPRGGGEITEMVAKRLGTGFDEAEQLKCRVGLRAELGDEVASLIREAVQPLVNEIRNSFAYLNAGEQQARVARLALSGGGSLLPGLAETLSADIGVDVVPADPTIRFVKGRRRGRNEGIAPDHPSAAVSIGLALGVNP